MWWIFILGFDIIGTVLKVSKRERKGPSPKVSKLEQRGQTFSDEGEKYEKTNNI